MHETRGDLESLQRLLDDSYARAGEHLRAIHAPECRLRADRLCALLAGICIWDLATVTRAGAPRVAPIDGLFFRGRLLVGLTPDSVRARQLRERTEVSAAHTLGESLTVVIHGTAVEVDCADRAETPLLEAFREAYGWSDEYSGAWGKGPFWRIEPRQMFAAELRPV